MMVLQILLFWLSAVSSKDCGLFFLVEFDRCGLFGYFEKPLQILNSNGLLRLMTGKELLAPLPDRPPVLLARLGWRQTGSKNHLGRQPQLWESQRLNCVIALKLFYLILAVNQLANR